MILGLYIGIVIPIIFVWSIYRETKYDFDEDNYL